MTNPKPIIGEVAGRLSEGAWDRFLNPEEFPSHILRSEGYAASGSLFRLYDEMEEKDAHLFAVLQTRKNGVLSCPRKVIATSEGPAPQEVARFVEEALSRIRGFDQSLMHILDALGKGLSVQEIIWEVRDGRVHAAELKSRAPERFTFAPDGSLRLQDHGRTRPEGLISRQGRTAGLPLPERKFIRFTFGGLYDNPWGKGLCARAYWHYWFKKNNLKFWLVYNEKFGAPTIIGRYGPGASDEDRDRLLEVIDSLQNDTGVTVPDSITLDLLEAKRSGNVSTYQELASWCNDEVSKLVLGATLTSSEGRRSGSLALAKVHQEVRNEYVEADARTLEEVLNNQLVRWLVDFNFGAHVPAPRWTLDTSRREDLEREISVDRQLVALGVALPRRHFYDKYKRPAPLDTESVLSHDDQNLFQYHLAYGIVTVNEARTRLGLDPVPWGDARVEPQAPRRLGQSNDAESPAPVVPEGGSEEERENDSDLDASK
ncbi:DUF935 family protein [bacterium]|nr:DUF935 family protein [bacterium]